MTNFSLLSGADSVSDPHQIQSPRSVCWLQNQHEMNEARDDFVVVWSSVPGFFVSVITRSFSHFTKMCDPGREKSLYVAYQGVT